MEEINGVINIFKEKGYTSHDVVNVIRKKLGRIKTGHTGTLDPEATGVLPICVGKATKLSGYIVDGKKQYRAVVKLGHTTTTQDATGDIIKSLPIKCSENDIKNVVKNFIGENMQIPPMYSAIKINGKKLYELAREGKEIERKKRKIFIYNIQINKFIEKDRFLITVDCSKGTYIRTLCNDIGKALGCGAYMESLVRTKTGNFFIEKAIKLEEIDEILKNKKINEIICPMDEILKGYKKVIVGKNANKFLYNGNKISINFIKNAMDIKINENIIVYDEDNILIGIYIFCETYIKPITMLL